MRTQNSYQDKNKSDSTDKILLESSQPRFVKQFYIFKNEVFIGWDCFLKEKVYIGSGSKADLLLEEEGILDIHALVYFKGGQIIMSDKTQNGSVYVNNRKVKKATLGRFDFIDIGPYTIKIKCKDNKSRLSDYERMEHHETIDTGTEGKRPAVPEKIEKKTPPEKEKDDPEENSDAENPGDTFCREKHDRDNALSDILEPEKERERDAERYRLVFQGEISDRFHIEEVKKNLTERLRTDESKIKWLYSETPVVINKDMNHWNALQLCALIEEAGAKVKIENLN